MLSQGTPEAVLGFRQAQRAAATAVAEAKQQAWVEFGEAMEKDFQVAPKRFWKTVRHLRGETGNHPSCVQQGWDLVDFS